MLSYRPTSKLDKCAFIKSFLKEHTNYYG